MQGEIARDGRIRMNFYLSEQQYRLIETLASYDGRSMSDVLREAVRHYLQDRKDDINGQDRTQPE